MALTTEVCKVCFITTLDIHRQRPLSLCLHLLLCDFEDDFEFYRHPERKAGNANHQPNRCFLGAKDISKKVRYSVRDLGLIEGVPVGRNENTQPDDARHSIE